MVLVGLLPGREGPVAVFASPFGSGTVYEVLAKSGGSLISAAPSGWVAVIDRNGTASNSELYAAGAFFVASSAIASTCIWLSTRGSGVNS
ncbi:hypothetical protein E1178_02635 [Roseibium hamelinense]|nr:hypothetical protein [Roseibium hamelinense]